MSEPLRLTDAQREFVLSARRAVLVTIASDGRPRPVPICHVLDGDGSVLWTPIDAKPKQTGDPLRLARVRDLLARPTVSVLVDRWDEDWSKLGWLRLDGRARLLPAGDADSVEERRTAFVALRDRYPPYATHDLEALPLIRVTIERVTGWGTGATG